MKRILLSIFCTFCVSILLHAQENMSLSITVDNIKEVKGILEVYLYIGQENFLEDDKEYALHRFQVDNKKMTVTINNLPKQDYAYFLYQDINSDEECNLNFLGIPKEPYGFSNNFKPVLSKPNFDQCKISAEGKVKTTTSLIY